MEFTESWMQVVAIIVAIVAMIFLLFVITNKDEIESVKCATVTMLFATVCMLIIFFGGELESSVRCAYGTIGSIGILATFGASVYLHVKSR